MVVSALATTLKGMTGAGPRVRGGAARKGNGAASFSAILASKSGFLVQTFAMLMAQLAVTGIVAWQVAGRESVVRWLSAQRWMLFLATLLVAIVLAFLPMPVAAKAALFTAMSSLIGLIMASAGPLNSRVVFNALGAVFTLFAGMFGLGVLATLGGVDLVWLGVALFVVLTALTIWRVVAAVSRDGDGDGGLRRRAMSGFIVGLFSLYILYDTWNILRRDYSGDFVTAALDYYLDVLNIFLELVGR
eukprot:jgi/Tetstr1/454288/TSEL_041207.t1